MDEPTSLSLLLTGILAERFPNGKGDANILAAATKLRVSYHQLHAWANARRLPSPGQLDGLMLLLGMNADRRELARRLLTADDKKRQDIREFRRQQARMA